MKKKILSVMLSALMVLSVLPVGAAALENNEALFGDGTKTPHFKYWNYVTDEYGARKRVDYDNDGNVIEYENDVLYTASTTLPSSYDARTQNCITSIKNQNPFGTCWSFAFCASAESSLISQGYETKDSVDLSEAHLAWFRLANYVEGSSIPVQQDRRILTDVSTFDIGGNIEDAAAAVARWSGLVREEDYPYSANEDDMHFPASAMFDNDYNLTSAVIYRPWETDEIKQAIMKNGAVATAVYYNSNYEKKYSGGSCYYQNITDGSNHSVTCIGWDDNYPASNFKYRPEGDGAWLIKNSWGESFNDGGYFWLSYYDPSISEFGEINVKPSGDYDNNYQYDGQIELISIQMGNSVYVSNIFTAEGKELVKACGFWLEDDEPFEITASVYTGLNNASVPTSGTLCESKTVYTSHKGYYSIDFDGEYNVSAGEKFSIVLKVRNTSGGDTFIPFELNGISPEYVYSFDVGQSFFSGTGTDWNDMALSGFGNIPIKAFTSDYKETVVSPKTGKNTVIDDENGYIYGLDFGIKSLDSYITLSDGCTYSCTGFGTGGKVNIKSGGQTVKTYEIVIFGDENGDGWADGTDAVLVSCYADGLLSGDGALSFAADCNHDGQIDVLDVELVQNAGILINNINQNASAEDLLSTASYQEYSQIISQTLTGETAIEEEITAEASAGNTARIPLNFFDIFIMLITKLLNYLLRS